MGKVWVSVLLSLLLIYAAARFFGPTKDPEVPKLSNTEYWGPGRPDKVDESVRPFKINISKEVIDDLKSRLGKTRELRKPLEGTGWTYGVDTEYIKTILDYWRTKYDWNKRQTLLNKYPQFKTNIQGLDIHFYHVKPTLPKGSSVKVFPLLLVHGWPGSVVEFQKIIPLLTTPRAGQDFVFELIIPSLPGYGFSDAAVRPGLATTQMSVVLKNLMNRLGFEKFYTQGGDWGSIITMNIAILYPESVLGTHLNMCFTNSPSNTLWSIVGSYIPSLIVSDEHWSRMYPLKEHWLRLLEESGYFHIQATKPDTIGVALSDSPAGLATYILEKFSTWTNPDYRFKQDGGLLEKYTIDELLDNVMIYWVTNSITTSMRLYSENFSTAHRNLGMDEIPLSTPTACTAFPYELAYQSESLLRSKYKNLLQYNHYSQGGHFAALEQPQLLADDFWSFVTKVEAEKKSAKTAKSTEL